MERRFAVAPLPMPPKASPVDLLAAGSAGAGLGTNDADDDGVYEGRGLGTAAAEGAGAAAARAFSALGEARIPPDVSIVAPSDAGIACSFVWHGTQKMSPPRSRSVRGSSARAQTLHLTHALW